MQTRDATVTIHVCTQDIFIYTTIVPLPVYFRVVAAVEAVKKIAWRLLAVVKRVSHIESKIPKYKLFPGSYIPT